MAAVVVLAALGLSGIGLGLNGTTAPPSPDAGQQGALPASGLNAPRGPALPTSRPARLDVPSVGIHTNLVDLGLNPDGTLEVPSEPLLAGWYTGSPTPGERGPSVIAGHVDARETGPAVFYRLSQVAPGAAVDVTRRDGSVAHFTVTAVRSYAKSDFPTQTVYGNTSGATLRLITCGDWNDTSQEYDGNVVVFAQLDVVLPP
jgi:LPXTG-site transpeptidase (sortase) family protein